MKLVLSGNAPLSVLAAAPMLVAAVIQGSVGALVTADGTHQRVLLAAQILPAALLALGPRLQEHSVRLDPVRSVHRVRRPYSLLPYTTLVGLFATLDDFKVVNDTHGHHAGDAVLVGVAERLAASVPTGGTAARIGGDEFAVLLRGPTCAPRTPSPAGSWNCWTCRCPSTGTSCWCGRALASSTATRRPPRLLQRADARMYATKRETQMSSSS